MVINPSIEIFFNSHPQKHRILGDSFHFISILMGFDQLSFWGMTETPLRTRQIFLANASWDGQAMCYSCLGAVMTMVGAMAAMSPFCFMKDFTCAHTYAITCIYHVYVYVCIYTHTHTYTYAYAYAYVHIYIHTYIRTYVRTDRQKDRQTDRQADRQTHRHTYLPTYLPT